MTNTHFRKLIDNLKYNDFFYEGGGVWASLIPEAFKVIVIISRKENKVELLNKPFPFQSDAHGYLDGVVVKPEHAWTVIRWMLNE